MMRQVFLIAICSILNFLSIELQSAETLYPSGFSITSQYELSASTITTADTLVITRTIVNHESFILTGLYYSENLSPEFQVESHSITLNGAGISYSFLGPSSNSVITGYNTYYWIVDEPGSSGSIHNDINPGDSLVLTLMLTCSTVGDYSLPLHTTVFYGNASGIFSTGDTQAITVQMSVGIDDENGSEGLLPDVYLISSVFPNPFNSQATIYYEALNLQGKPLKLQIYNALGQLVYQSRPVAAENEGWINWHPEEGTGSGVYFYQLSTSETNSKGKLVLLK